MTDSAAARQEAADAESIYAALTSSSRITKHGVERRTDGSREYYATIDGEKRTDVVAFAEHAAPSWWTTAGRIMRDRMNAEYRARTAEASRSTACEVRTRLARPQSQNRRASHGYKTVAVRSRRTTPSASGDSGQSGLAEPPGEPARARVNFAYLNPVCSAFTGRSKRRASFRVAARRSPLQSTDRMGRNFSSEVVA